VAKLKSFKRIVTTDYPADNRELIEKLGLSLNDSINDILFTLNGRVDLQNNIQCTVKLFDVIVDTQGTPTTRTIFTVNNPGVPVLGISVLSATNKDNPAIYPTGYPFISFTQTDSGILINNITGLQAGQRYSLRIVAWN